MKKLEELFPRAWVYDIETFANLFTVVFRKVGTKQYEKFVIHESQNDSKELIAFLKAQKPMMVGFNNLAFDAQIIEKIYRKQGKMVAEDIYAFGQETIERLDKDRFDTEYSEWDLSFKQIDLYKLNHYDNRSRRTSLKWLEFTIRFPKMKDLPFHHTTQISKSNVAKVLSYNVNDVDVTYDFFYICTPQLMLRYDLGKEYNEWRMINMSDASIGAFIFKNMLLKRVDKKKLGKTVKRTTIDLKDCLVPYLSFSTKPFQDVLKRYQETKIEYHKTGLKGAINHVVDYDGMEFSFGTGGIHAAYKSGVYEADDDHVILSIDGTSYYPWVIIANNFYPEHIGKMYCNVYRHVYQMRTQYEKGTAMNYALKIVLNSVYGKSNSHYSYLFDPMLTLKITVNGQLMLAMLAEQLSRYGRLLMVNTDGLEIKVPKKNLGEVKDVCSMWEAVTGINLEEKEYKKVVIRDVNSYIAVDMKGNAKRNGYFALYEDIIGEDGSAHQLHKNPSANIIPLALYEHFINGVPVEETIYNHNNIHDFTYAIKSKRGFDFWFITADDDGVIEIDKRTDRVLRYFISKKGANIYKHFHDNRKSSPTAVNKGHLVELAMVISDPEINGVVKAGKYKGEPLTTYDNLNRDHYIAECYKTLDEIQHGRTTTEEEE